MELNYKLLRVDDSDEAKQKNMRVSGYMLLKIRVGRSDYFFTFEIIFFAISTFFYKYRTGLSTFVSQNN